MAEITVDAPVRVASIDKEKSYFFILKLEEERSFAKCKSYIDINKI